MHNADLVQLNKYIEPAKLVYNIDQNNLMGVEKIAMTFACRPQIFVRATIHCSNCNISIKTAFNMAKPSEPIRLSAFKSVYWVHTELKSITSIEIERHNVISNEDDICVYKRVYLSIKYITNGTTFLVNINKNGNCDITTDGFKCMMETCTLPAIFGVVDGENTTITTIDHKKLLSEFRGYPIDDIEYGQYTLPLRLLSDTNIIAKPGDVAIENKCGEIHMNYNIFCLTFIVVLTSAGGKALVMNNKGLKRNIEWGLGDHIYRSNDGEYYKYSYFVLPGANCINNSKNAFGLAVATANYLIGNLI